MNDTTKLLDSVRDIHEPLPPESSSALLLGLLFTLIIAFAFAALVYAYKRRNKVNRELQSELQIIAYEQPDKAIVCIAVLLRRIMHYVHGDKINQLEDKPWLEALNSTFNTQYFTDGKGQIFGNALYANGCKTDTRTICKDISKLIGKTHLAAKP